LSLAPRRSYCVWLGGFVGWLSAQSWTVVWQLQCSAWRSVSSNAADGKQFILRHTTDATVRSVVHIPKAVATSAFTLNYRGNFKEPLGRSGDGCLQAFADSPVGTTNRSPGPKPVRSPVIRVQRNWSLTIVFQVITSGHSQRSVVREQHAVSGNSHHPPVEAGAFG